MPFDVYLNVAIGGVLTGLVYGLMALGLSVIFGVVRVVNFAHGEMMTIAMFIAVVLCTGFHLDPLILLVPIAAVMFVFGYVLQRGLINLFETRPEHSQFLLLVALGLIIANALLIVFGPDARSVQTAYGYESFQTGPMIVDAAKVYAGAAAIVVTAVLFAFFRLTLVGKAIRACADNHTGALVVGLDVKRLYALTFGIGAACVGAAGTMLVLLVDATPMLGPSYTLLAFVIVITGGLGSMPGALVGGVLIGVTEALAGLRVTPSIKSMFAFGILVLVLLFRPQGILAGRLHDLTPDRRSVAARHRSAYAAAGGVPRGAADRGDYLLTILIIILYFAYTGQAWNIMMGFAGQLRSGTRSISGSAAMSRQFCSLSSGSAPGWACWRLCPLRRQRGRLSVSLPFASALLVSISPSSPSPLPNLWIGFDNWNFVNGSGGLFLQVKQYDHNDLWRLRGDPTCSTTSSSPRRLRYSRSAVVLSAAASAISGSPSARTNRRHAPPASIPSVTRCMR